MTGLERRYRWLLRAYPSWYRRDCGDDMLGTLLDRESGGGWPAPGEALALVTGGLRVRSSLNRRLSTTAGLRLAALFGLALVVTVRAGHLLGVDLVFVLHPLAARGGLSGYQVACEMLSLSAAASCWIARRAVTVTLAVAAAVLCVTGFTGTVAILPAGTLIALALLSLGSERMPKLWLVAACAAFAIATAGELTGFFAVAPPELYVYLQYATWALYAMAVLWVVIDPRPAFAMAIYLLIAYIGGDVVFLAFYGSGPGPAWTWILPAASSVVLAAGATWRLRRQLVP